MQTKALLGSLEKFGAMTLHTFGVQVGIPRFWAVEEDLERQTTV